MARDSCVWQAAKLDVRSHLGPVKLKSFILDMELWHWVYTLLAFILLWSNLSLL